MSVEYIDNYDELKYEKEHIVRGQNKYGYGMKISSCYMVRIGKIWRRVYYTCVSNNMSAWIVIKGKKKFLNDCVF